jgi:hypothetical protein
MPDFLNVPPRDRDAIVDALYRFGAGQDLHDAALFVMSARYDVITSAELLDAWSESDRIAAAA